MLAVLGAPRALPSIAALPRALLFSYPKFLKQKKKKKNLLILKIVFLNLIFLSRRKFEGRRRDVEEGVAGGRVPVPVPARGGGAGR